MSKLRLIQSHVFFRHGARTPIRTIPAECVAEAEYPVALLDLDSQLFHPVEHVQIDGSQLPDEQPFYELRNLENPLKGGAWIGQLTKVGQQQSVELGKRLHTKYITTHNLISLPLQTHEVFVRSTYMKRTIQTAESVLGGLADTCTKASGEPEALPLEMEMWYDEFLYPNHSRYADILTHTKVEDWHNWQLHSELLPAAMSEAHSTMEAELECEVNLVGVRDDIVAREAHGISVPDVLEKHRNEIELYATIAQKHAIIGYTEEEKERSKKLFAGEIVHMLLEKLKVAGEPSTQLLHLYAVHDTSLMALLYALDLFTNEWPPFCADLAFDLYQMDVNEPPLLQIVYLGEPLHPKGADSEGFISLSDFEAATAPIRLSHEEARTLAKITPDESLSNPGVSK